MSVTTHFAVVTKCGLYIGLLSDFYLVKHNVVPDPRPRLMTHKWQYKCYSELITDIILGSCTHMQSQLMLRWMQTCDLSNHKVQIAIVSLDIDYSVNSPSYYSHAYAR